MPHKKASFFGSFRDGTSRPQTKKDEFDTNIDAVGSHTCTLFSSFTVLFLSPSALYLLPVFNCSSISRTFLPLLLIWISLPRSILDGSGGTASDSTQYHHYSSRPQNAADIERRKHVIYLVLIAWSELLAEMSFSTKKTHH